VTQVAQAQTFFAGILGVGTFNIRATAVASRLSTTGGSPLAVYVHEVCGASTGNKGLNVNGEDALVQGAIHSNGQFKISGEDFESEAETTAYRPVNLPGSPLDPAHPQGSCDSNTAPGEIRVTDAAGSEYCTVVCGGNDLPTYGPWRDWATAGRYDTPDMVETEVEQTPGVTCVNPDPGNNWELKASDLPGGVLANPTCYRLDLDKKFTLSGAIKGPLGGHARLTVIAGEITVNTAAGAKIRPVGADESALFYSWKTGGEVNINPAGTLDWIGFVMNHKGGMTVNSGNVVSPRAGMLEAEWIVINGEDFEMEGRGPPTIGGTGFGGVALEE
jgi:hypothetical protein